MTSSEALELTIKNLEARQRAKAWKKAGRSVARTVAKGIRGRVLERANNKCQACDMYAPWIMEVHHVKPLEDEGGWNTSDMIALCPNCHSIVEKLRSKTGNDTQFHVWIIGVCGDKTYKRLLKFADRQKGQADAPRG